MSQQVLPLLPADAVPVGPLAGLVESEQGGVVFVNGMASFAFAADDVVGRRLAAVQLVAAKNASVGAVAAAFGVTQVTLWRWREAFADGGAVRGWSNYLKHALAKHTFHSLAHFVWWRVVRWLRTLHGWKWKEFRRRFTTTDGRWKPVAVDGIELFNLETVPVTRYRHRGNTIPNPWTLHNHAPTAVLVESPVR